MAEYLMGIDAGTGSVRVALFDFRGQNRAYAVAEYGTTYPKNGWAEQSDYEWFEALKKAIEAGRSAYLSGLGRTIERGASASSPLTGFLED